MGAIFGIWNRKGDPVDPQETGSMRDALGGYGSSCGEPVHFGNASFGCFYSPLNNRIQPNRIEFSGEKRDVVLVADARIYNRDDLLNECGLSERKDVSDSEILMAAYLLWGEKTPLHVNGDFAFAVFNHNKEEIRLFSDHLGVRPIFYYEDADIFVFATDYHAILSLGRIPRRVNEAMLYRLISSDYVSLPEDTHIDGLRKVPQAHFIHADRLSSHKVKYWTPGRNGLRVPENEEECVREVRDLMRNAVEIRTEAVTELIATDLSGGLDSSCITVYAAGYLRQQDKKPMCFCWAPSFEIVPEQPRDERKLVEMVCEQEGLLCDYFSVDNQGELARILQESGGGVIEEELRVLKNKGVRAVFSGWGGDQGITHRTNLLELRVNGYYKEFFSEIRGVSRGSVLRAAKLFIRNSGIGVCLGRIFSRDRMSLDTAIRPEMRRKFKARFGRDQLQFNRDILRHLESGNIQSRTHLCAGLSARYGIEYLFPFLDYRLIDYAFSLPRHLFFKHGINRYIARKAMTGVLPEEVRTYAPKDDVVRCSYFGAQKEKSDTAESISTEGIQKNVFDPFIDFDRLDRLIRSKKIQKSKRFRRMVARRIRQIKEIQTDFD
ncbi:MAG: hypothetical protein JW780_07425 [Clostridiales bacterium]|nr:hypothetical protein [Clostridiales bacterium]